MRHPKLFTALILAVAAICSPLPATAQNSLYSDGAAILLKREADNFGISPYSAFEFSQLGRSRSHTFTLGRTLTSTYDFEYASKRAHHYRQRSLAFFEGRMQLDFEAARVAACSALLAGFPADSTETAVAGATIGCGTYEDALREAAKLRYFVIAARLAIERIIVDEMRREMNERGKVWIERFSQNMLYAPARTTHLAAEAAAYALREDLPACAPPGGEARVEYAMAVLREETPACDATTAADTTSTR